MTGDQTAAIIIFGVTFVMILAERVHRTISWPSSARSSC